MNQPRLCSSPIRHGRHKGAQTYLHHGRLSMNIHFDLVRHRRRAKHPLCRRIYHDHLRILVVLPGRKRKHLANVELTPRTKVHPEAVGPIIEQCRQRLAEICNNPEEVGRLLARIENRLSREVETTAEALEKHRALVGWREESARR